MDNNIALKLRESIKRHEGFKKLPYNDTRGNLTIGYGRNLRSVGISETEADIMLNDDIINATVELYRFIPWTQNLDDSRKAAFIELNFNMGIEKLLGFRKMLDYAKENDWPNASKELLDSDWKAEVGNRANDIAYVLENGIL